MFRADALHRLRGADAVYVGSEHTKRPPWELKDFRSVALDAGAEEDVAFTLPERALSQWDSELGDWAPRLAERIVSRAARRL